MVDGKSKTILFAENSNSLSWYAYSISNDHVDTKSVWFGITQASAVARVGPSPLS